MENLNNSLELLVNTTYILIIKVKKRTFIQSNEESKEWIKHRPRVWRWEVKWSHAEAIFGTEQENISPNSKHYLWEFTRGSSQLFQTWTIQLPNPPPTIPNLTIPQNSPHSNKAP